MYKIIHKIVFSLLLFVGAAQADTKLYTDGLGLPAGSSYTVANTTFYNDGLGLPFATANKVGNTSIYANALGLPMGSSQSIGPNPLGSNSPSPFQSPFDTGYNDEPF